MVREGDGWGTEQRAYKSVGLAAIACGQFRRGWLNPKLSQSLGIMVPGQVNPSKVTDPIEVADASELLAPPTYGGRPNVS